MEAQSNVEIDWSAHFWLFATVSFSVCVVSLLNQPRLLFLPQNPNYQMIFLINLLAFALISLGYLYTRIHKNVAVEWLAPNMLVLFLTGNQFHSQIWPVGHRHIDIVPAAGDIFPCCKSVNAIK